jgi:hypothetical protein
VVKRLGREADLSTRSAEVKNEWSYIYTSPSVLFVAWSGTTSRFIEITLDLIITA